MQRIFASRKPGEAANWSEIGGRIAAIVPGILAAVALLGLLLTAGLSLTEYYVLEPPKLIGMRNYSTLLANDDLFPIALKNTWTDLWVIGVGGFLMCLWISLMLRRLPRFVRYGVIALMLFPLLSNQLLPLTKWILGGDSYGLLNGWLLNRGIIREPLLFMQVDKYLPHITRLLQLWCSLGPGVLVISAGLEGVRPAAMLEARQRGLQEHIRPFWFATLPRMRAPLMLASAVMVMAALGTSRISETLVGFPSVNHCCHTLMGHVHDYLLIRYEVGYAAAILCVTLLFVMMLLTLMWSCIWLLTWRPGRRKLEGQPISEQVAEASRKWDDWSILWLVMGISTAVTLVIPVLQMIRLTLDLAAMPLDELFKFPPTMKPENPTLENYGNFMMLMQSLPISLGMELLKALGFAALLLPLAAAIAWFSGHALSCRKSKVRRRLLIASLLLMTLFSFAAHYVDIDYTETTEFGDVLRWVGWVFAPVCVAMGLSFDGIVRRPRPQWRIIAAATGVVCTSLYFIWMGVLGRQYKFISAGSRALLGMEAAGAVLLDFPILLLSFPMVAGLTTLLSGLGNTSPFLQEEMNEQK